MSSRGDEQKCSQEAGKPREDKEEEENFFDCQETVEPPDRRGAEEEGTRQVEGASEDFEIQTDRLTDRREQEEQGDRLRGDFDSEIEENSQEVEFDDDYLREVEKELTEEEKEVTSAPVRVTVCCVEMSAKGKG